MKNDFCKICGQCFDEKFPEATHHCTGKTSEVLNFDYVKMERETKELLGREIPEVIFDEASNIPQDTWNKINERIKQAGKAARAVVDKIAEESGIDKSIIYHKCGRLKLSGDGDTCPTCLINPAVEKVFNANEISMKLYDAKFRGIIDGDQLFKLLDYFEEKEADED